MSIQQNYGNIKPSLNLDFAGTKQLDPRITYSRASTGTYYDGKAVAKAEENLLTFSEQFDNAVWTVGGTSVSANTTAAPDGTTTAEKLVSSSTTGEQRIYRGAGVSTIVGQVYTYSVYAKSDTVPFVIFRDDFGGYGDTSFNISAGTVGTVASGKTATITFVGNGWYRCSVTATSSQTTQQLMFCLASADNGRTSFTGNGTSGVFLWGAQLEQRSTATAYTPTTTAPVTNYIPVLQTASAGTPRFDHNPITGESLGLLIEEQRTNLLTYSETFGSASWVKSGATIAANAVVSPDGTVDANKLTEDTSTGNHECRQVLSSTVTGSYTGSVYIKAAGRSRAVLILFGTNFAYVDSTFDLVNGTVVSGNGSGTITSVGNGYYRCTITGTASSAGNTNFYIRADNGTTSSYTGNGFSGIYIWGAQLETGAFATSYMPTALTYSGRASAGTFRGSNGLLQTAAVNAPRYEVNAGGGSNLLLENAASNLLSYTEHFDNAAWTSSGISISTNTAAAPDGTLTADTLTSNTGNGYISRGFSASAGVFYTFSCWIKSVSAGNSLELNLYTDGGSVSVAAQIVTTTGSWQRVSVTGTYASASSTALAVVGGNASFTTGESLYIWGAQLESGSTATSYIPSLETFTGRASTATYYDSTGIIRTAASGQPRYSYNPALLSVAPKLLLEAQGTNLLTFSEQFDDATWVKASSATVTANAIGAPNGLVGADLLTTTGGSSQLYQQQVLSNGTYTFSVFVKRSTADLFMLDLSDSSTGDAIVSYSIDSGTVTSVSSGGSWSGTSGTIQNVGNGWYRCTLTATKGAGASIIAKMQASVGSGAFYIWGAQLETGSGATSYIPTVASQVTRVADTSTSAAQSRAADVYSSSQVTRAADSAAITGTNFSSWYNQSEGSIYCESFIPLAADNTEANYYFSINDGTVNNMILAADVNGTVFQVIANSVQFNQTVGTEPSTFAKIALAYKTNDFIGCVNSVLSSSDTSGTLPTVNRLSIGTRGDSLLNTINGGTIKKLSYYPRRITNTQLQALTS